MTLIFFIVGVLVLGALLLPTSSRWKKVALSTILGIPLYVVIMLIAGIFILTFLTRIPSEGLILFLVGVSILGILFFLKKRYILLILLIVIPISSHALLLYGFDKTTCGYKYSDKQYSSDGKYSVQVAQHDCGATTRFSSNVMLRREKKKSLFYWNNRHSVFSAYSPLSDIDTRWIGSNVVQIAHSDCKNISDIHGRQGRWQKIEIIENCL